MLGWVQMSSPGHSKEPSPRRHDSFQLSTVASTALRSCSVHTPMAREPTLRCTGSRTQSRCGTAQHGALAATSDLTPTVPRRPSHNYSGDGYVCASWKQCLQSEAASVPDTCGSCGTGNAMTHAQAST